MKLYSITMAVWSGIQRVKVGEITADDLVLMELPAIMKATQDGYDETAHRLYALWRRCEDGGDYDSDEFIRRAEAVLNGRVVGLTTAGDASKLNGGPHESNQG